MKTVYNGAERPAPEKLRTVAILEGAHAVFVGYATQAQFEKIMNILLEERRKMAQ